MDLLPCDHKNPNEFGAGTLSLKQKRIQDDIIEIPIELLKAKSIMVQTFTFKFMIIICFRRN